MTRIYHINIPKSQTCAFFYKGTDADEFLNIASEAKKVIVNINSDEDILFDSVQ